MGEYVVENKSVVINHENKTAAEVNPKENQTEKEIEQTENRTDNETRNSQYASKENNNDEKPDNPESEPELLIEMKGPKKDDMIRTQKVDQTDENTDKPGTENPDDQQTNGAQGTKGNG